MTARIKCPRNPGTKRKTKIKNLRWTSWELFLVVGTRDPRHRTLQARHAVATNLNSSHSRDLIPLEKDLYRVAFGLLQNAPSPSRNTRQSNLEPQPTHERFKHPNSIHQSY